MQGHCSLFFWGLQGVWVACLTAAILRTALEREEGRPADEKSREKG
jgi:hypothetical protein